MGGEPFLKPDIHDKWVWKPSNDDQFSTKNVYTLLSQVEELRFFKKIWDKIGELCGTVSLLKSISVVEGFYRIMKIYRNCPVCKDTLEPSVHILQLHCKGTTISGINVLSGWIFRL